MCAVEESAERPGVRPCFPYVAVLLCAACLTAAAWAWMRYSYAWEFSPSQLSEEGNKGLGTRWPHAAYLRVAASQDDYYASTMYDFARNITRYQLTPSTGPGSIVYVVGFAPEMDANRNAGAGYVGRVDGTWLPNHMCLHTSASRFAWQSITGLFVGAIGVFVFSVALRHWLRQRKARAARTAGSRPPESPA